MHQGFRAGVNRGCVSPSEHLKHLESVAASQLSLVTGQNSVVWEVKNSCTLHPHRILVRPPTTRTRQKTSRHTVNEEHLRRRRRPPPLHHRRTARYHHDRHPCIIDGLHDTIMPHQNPNMPTNPFAGWIQCWQKEPQVQPTTALFQPREAAQVPAPAENLPVTPQLTHAAKTLLRAMRRLLEMLVEVTFLIEQTPEAASKASKDEIFVLLREAQHLSKQTMDKAVEQQIVLLLEDAKDPNLSPQRKRLHGTPIYDATTHVGTHPQNASPSYYNPRLEPTVEQQWLRKIAAEREAREARSMGYLQVAQARGAMVASMQAWMRMGGGGMMHVHECANAVPPPANEHEANLHLYEELEAQREVRASTLQHPRAGREPGGSKGGNREITGRSRRGRCRSAKACSPCGATRPQPAPRLQLSCNASPLALSPRICAPVLSSAKLPCGRHRSSPRPPRRLPRSRSSTRRRKRRWPSRCSSASRRGFTP